MIYAVGVMAVSRHLQKSPPQVRQVLLHTEEFLCGDAQGKRGHVPAFAGAPVVRFFCKVEHCYLQIVEQYRFGIPVGRPDRFDAIVNSPVIFLYKADPFQRGNRFPGLSRSDGRLNPAPQITIVAAEFETGDRFADGKVIPFVEKSVLFCRKNRCFRLLERQQLFEMPGLFGLRF